MSHVLSVKMRSMTSQLIAILFTESNADIYKTNPEKANTSVSEVFRCGTPKTIEGYRERIALQRRTDYGKAIRNHMARPKSASEFFCK